MTTKPGTPNSVLTKTLIFSWIKQIVPDLSPKIKVQDLGTGQLYCRIINHYFPNSITSNRINFHPKNEYQYSLNLKMFQNSLTLHKINILFDVGKISKLKFLENWILVNALYKHLVTNTDDNTYNPNDDAKSVSCAPVKYTPKRSFECAFSNQQSNKLPQISNLIKPNFYQHSPQISNFNNQQTIQASQPNQTVQMGQSMQQNINQALQQNMNTNYLKLKNEYQPINMHQSISWQNQVQNEQLNSVTNDPFPTMQKSVPPNKMSNLMNPLNNTTNNSLNTTNNLLNVTNNSLNTMSNFYNSTNNLYKPMIHNDFVNQNRLNSQEGKCYSVGKLSNYPNSPFLHEGKYSVNSHVFHNNYNAIIDRVKQILLKASHDLEKIRQIKILLNIPLNDGIVKIQQEDNCIIKIIQNNSNHKQIIKSTSNDKQIIKPTSNDKQIIKITLNDKQNKIISQKVKQTERQVVKQHSINVSSPVEASSSKQKNRQLSNISHKIDNDQNRQSNCSNEINMKKSVTEFVMKKQGLENSHKRQPSSLKIPQSSGKKIKNNFFGEGSVFRK